MKKLQVVFFLTMTAVLGTVVWDYFGFHRTEDHTQSEEPGAIPPEINSQAAGWAWSQSSGDHRKVEVAADSFRQAKDTFLFDLGGVKLKIFHKDSSSFDYITTKAAQFDTRSETLFSKGETVLSLGVPIEHPDYSSRKQTEIRSSGVIFETRTGVAKTKQYTEYEFAGGIANSVGIYYDSRKQYVRMDSKVHVELFPRGPHHPVLKIQSNTLYYYEREQRVRLIGEVSVNQGFQQIQSTEATVFMDRGKIVRIKASEAQGTETQSLRTISFSAQQVNVFYSPLQNVERMTGSGSVKISSSTETSTITSSGKKIELLYAVPVGHNESILQHVQIRGRAVVESISRRIANRRTDIHRRVRSAWVKLSMDENGQDVEVLQTLAPGTLDLIPADSSQRKRTLRANRMTAYYASNSQLRNLRAEGNVQVNSQLSEPPRPGEKSRTALTTWSKTLVAEFDPLSGEMLQLHQRSNFHFNQGSLRGSSDEAEFNPQTNEIKIQHNARIWEPTGSVSADRILLNETTGHFQAVGGVSSTHQESGEHTSEVAKQSRGPFSSLEPVHATADRMSSNQAIGLLDYRGHVRLWQGPNRIEADHIEIDRHARTLSADGQAVSFFQPLEIDPDNQPGRSESSVSLVRVSANSIFYDDLSQRALYRGGVELNRGRLKVLSNEMEAFLAPEESSDAQHGRLKRAIARGQVRIFDQPDAQTLRRSAAGVEADYNLTTERVILSGDPAWLKGDSGQQTRGTELTYQVNDDRLLVLGDDVERSYSYRPRTQQ